MHTVAYPIDFGFHPNCISSHKLSSLGLTQTAQWRHHTNSRIRPKHCLHFSTSRSLACRSSPTDQIIDAWVIFIRITSTLPFRAGTSTHLSKCGSLSTAMLLLRCIWFNVIHFASQRPHPLWMFALAGAYGKDKDYVILWQQQCTLGMGQTKRK